MWKYMHSDELYHYGVKGMKWGVRRAEKLANKYRKKMIAAINRGNNAKSAKTESYKEDRMADYYVVEREYTSIRERDW